MEPSHSKIGGLNDSTVLSLYIVASSSGFFICLRRVCRMLNLKGAVHPGTIAFSDRLPSNAVRFVFVLCFRHNWWHQARRESSQICGASQVDPGAPVSVENNTRETDECFASSTNTPTQTTVTTQFHFEVKSIFCMQAHFLKNPPCCRGLCYRFSSDGRRSNLGGL